MRLEHDLAEERLPHEPATQGGQKVAASRDVDHKPALVFRNRGKLGKQHRLAGAARPSDAHQTPRSPLAVGKALQKIVRDLLATHQHRGHLAGRRLKRVLILRDTSPHHPPV